MKQTSIIILLLFLFTSCSEVISVFVSLVNIDSNESELKINFKFKDFYRGTDSRVQNIYIYSEDSLICQLTAPRENGISEWNFPSIPEGFKVIRSDSMKNIPKITRDKNISFRFQGGVKFHGYGSWNYKSLYSKRSYRWLFNNEGKPKVTINCFYQKWIGKDVIKIETSEKFLIVDSTFILKKTCGKRLDYKVHYKQNPYNRIALVLEEPIKNGEKVIIRFKIPPDKLYKEEIIINEHSSVFIAGKDWK